MSINANVPFLKQSNFPYLYFTVQNSWWPSSNQFPNDDPPLAPIGCADIVFTEGILVYFVCK